MHEKHNKQARRAGLATSALRAAFARRSCVALCLQMKISKETIIGILVVFTILGIIAAATGLYGVVYIGVAFVIAIVSINLFSRKSAVAKTGAVILNTDLIYKILMPRKYRKAIEDLKEKEGHEKHNKRLWRQDP